MDTTIQIAAAICFFALYFMSVSLITLAIFVVISFNPLMNSYLATIFIVTGAVFLAQFSFKNNMTHK